ncbi:hypothetical protein [Actinomadura sp. WMMA1423]|uniref:hypothetical protein n=1 Tax=Actinomadura sp. WMMA1423 TaxID=2591108 RepID=UPI001146FDCE|nr:hypothetical protein [Actinomadura sp. WMMA1423]
MPKKSASLVAVAAMATGAAFGAGTSLINDLSSEYGTFGPRLADTSVAPALKVLSILLDAGWAWAALAVLMGWYASAGRGAKRAALRGAARGALALLAASVAYFCADAPLRGESLSSHLIEMVLWSIASVVLGPLLGAIGSQIGRKGLIGMLAGLVVPAGAVVQTLWLDVPALVRTGSDTAAEIIIWITAAATAAFVVARAFRTWGSRDLNPQTGAQHP